MSEPTTTTPHAEPSDRTYVGIALLLGVITAVEVASYYAEDALGAALVPSLLAMMVVKFVIVVGWFMHLRFDSNVYTRLFVTGLVLAVTVYAAVLATFRYF